MSHGNTIEYTVEQILEAIKGSGSIMSTVAKKLGCTWKTAETKINQHEETKQAFADERQTIIDMAESVVFNSIQEKDVQTAKWVLSTLGKKRGYSEKHELGFTDSSGEDKEIVIKLIKADGTTNS